jgi:hypothetical protein
LEDVVAGCGRVFTVRRLASDGVEAWKQVVECRYEGYVAKDERRVYEGGPPSGGRRKVAGLGPSRALYGAPNAREASAAT